MDSSHRDPTDAGSDPCRGIYEAALRAVEADGGDSRAELPSLLRSAPPPALGSRGAGDQRRLRPSAVAAVVLAALVVGARPSQAASAGDAPGVPFVTAAHAAADGDFSLACEQVATATLMPGTTPG